MKERQLFEAILTKFIINLPKQELEDFNRLSFHAEKAFYYYIDEIIREKDLKDWDRHRNEFFFKLKEYAPPAVKINPQQLSAKLKQNKPVCGAIIFNKDSTKVLAIRVRNKFGFPKGKRNQYESAEQCAARQVQQQTGVYIHNKIDPGIRIEFDTHGGTSSFFVARGVSEDERLKRDLREVDDIIWMWVEDVKANLPKFVERSRIAWGIYERLTGAQSPSIHDFIVQHLDPNRQKIQQAELNPFLNFKLDRAKLRQIISQSYD